MPLIINCGISRKASEDFQSSGVSINVTAELDAALLNRPGELQDKIAKLYQYAHDAVERQMVLTPPLPPRQTPRPEPWTKGRNMDECRPNGHNARPPARQNGNGNGNAPRPITPKQKSAILAICRQAEVDPFASARQTFGVDIDELSSLQASQLIDSLKGSAARN